MSSFLVCKHVPDRSCGKRIRLWNSASGAGLGLVDTTKDTENGRELAEWVRSEKGKTSLSYGPAALNLAQRSP